MVYEIIKLVSLFSSGTNEQTLQPTAAARPPDLLNVNSECHFNEVHLFNACY